MFRYMHLVDMLKQVVERGRQVKDVVYHQKKVKPSEVGAHYSLLNLIVNNFELFEKSCKIIEKKSGYEISNQMLLMVMMGEYINTGKIIGGGKLKRVLLEFKQEIPKIDRESKISKPVVQLRLRNNNADR